MKTQILSLILGLFLASSLSATKTEEERLAEEFSTKGPASEEQRHAMSDYFHYVAKKKAKEAKRYREIASLSYGGKANKEQARKKEYQKLAEDLEHEAKFYENLAKDSDKQLKAKGKN